MTKSHLNHLDTTSFMNQTIHITSKGYVVKWILDFSVLFLKKQGLFSKYFTLSTNTEYQK